MHQSGIRLGTMSAIVLGGEFYTPHGTVRLSIGFDLIEVRFREPDADC
jgi:hypothetical protein